MLREILEAFVKNCRQILLVIKREFKRINFNSTRNLQITYGVLIISEGLEVN